MTTRPSSREARVTFSSRFRKIERIGAIEGRNSEVWRAFDHQRGEQIILKEIDLAAFGSDPAAYFEESQAICAAACDRVVPLLSAGKDEYFVYLTMPEMAGSLAAKIREVPLSARDTITVGKDICDGVEAVHKSGRLHLDLKPTNVLFDQRGRALVADFGQSLPLDRLGAAVGEARLYYAYWPPEGVAGAPLTILSDVYQIGLTLYWAVNGEQWCASQLASIPDAELGSAIENGVFPDRSAFLPHVPDYLRRVITKALALNPEERYESAAEVGEALGKVDPRYDWQVTRDNVDGYSWRLSGEGAGRADVIVHAHYAGGRWSVEVWTQTGSGRPRRRAPDGANSLWGTGLTWSRASKLLKRAFRTLP